MPLDWCDEILGHHDIGGPWWRRSRTSRTVAMSHVHGHQGLHRRGAQGGQLLAEPQSARTRGGRCKGNLRMARWFVKRLREPPNQQQHL